MLTSAGPHVSLMLTSPAPPCTIDSWQEMAGLKKELSDRETEIGTLRQQLSELQTAPLNVSGQTALRKLSPVPLAPACKHANLGAAQSAQAAEAAATAAWAGAYGVDPQLVAHLDRTHHQPWALWDPHAPQPWAQCDPHAPQPWAQWEPHAHQPWALWIIAWQAKDLITNLLHKDPTKRLTIKQVK